MLRISYVDIHVAMKSLNVSSSNDESELNSKLQIKFLNNKLTFLIQTDGAFNQHTIDEGVYEAESNFEVVVLYTKLLTFLNTFSNYNDEFYVTLSLDKKGNLVVKTEKNAYIKSSKILLPTINNYNSPNIKEPDVPVSVSFKSSTLKEAYSRVKYALNPQDFGMPPALKCINCLIDEDYLTFVASDGILLCEYILHNSNQSQIVSQLLLEHTVINTVLNTIANKGYVPVEFYETKNILYIKTDRNFLGFSRIVNDEYPPYKNVLTNFNHKIFFESEDILLPLKSLKQFSDNSDNNRISLKIEGDTLSIFNDTVDFEVIVDNVDGIDISFDFNAIYLLNTLMALNDTSVVMYFSSSNAPVIFDGKDLDNQKSLVIPLKQR